jgi:arylsulfatase A-like enzyme
MHGLRGHIHNLTDSLIHVPLIVKLPAGHRRRDRLAERANELVPLIDVAPTILDVARLPDLPGQRGSSLLRSSEVVHIAETHRPEALHDLVSLRDERYKLVLVADEDRFELYDLQEDPLEQRDLFFARDDFRPAWQEQLRGIAERARAKAVWGEVDEATARMLESLGYAGNR